MIKSLEVSETKHGLTFLEYKRYRGEEGLMVFVECGKALAAYKKELIDRGIVVSIKRKKQKSEA